MKYKDSEVCHESLIHALSKDTGISSFEEVEVEIETVQGCFYVRDKDQDYFVNKSKAKGGVDCLRTVAPHSSVVFLIDRPWDKIYQRKFKTVHDFGVDIVIEKNAYSQSEGGGWSSNADIYNYKGKKYYWLS